MGFTFRSLVNINDRILLYLVNFNTPEENSKTNDEFDILTTDGIADAVFTDRNNMSYHIKNLKAHNYIDGILTHVKGKKRKQKIYFLTASGRNKAIEIKEKLKIKKITIMNSSEKNIDLKFPEVSAYLEDNILCRKITELEICKFANQIGHLDIDNVSKTDERFIDFIEGALKPKYFFGRKRELEQIKTWIDDEESYRFVIVHGIAGIGKTTFASKLIEDYKGTKHIFWHSCNNWDSIRSIISRVIEFIKKIYGEESKLFINLNQPLDLDEIIKLLKENIEKLNALFVFDDFHKVSDELRDFFRIIIEEFEKINNIKIIILTRFNIPFYDQQKVLVRRSVAELQIEGLDFESSSEILSRKHLPKSKYKKIHKITSGSPLLLEIIESEKKTQRYIYEEIFSQFSTDEKKIMEVLSTYKNSINYDAFFIDENIEPAPIDNLIRKLIIKQTPEGLYDSHEFIKEFFYKRLSPHDKRQYHSSCADFYNKQNKPLAYLEALFHYMRSEQYQVTIDLILKNAQAIINQGLSDRFLKILQELPEDQVSLSQWTDILMLKGKLCLIIGDWDKSLLYFDRTVEVGTEADKKSITAQAYCEIGHILEEQNLFDEALKKFQKCLDISLNLKDNKLLAEAKRGIGRYYWRKSDYKTAEKYYKEGLKTLKNIDDIGLIGSIYIDLGNIYLETRKSAKAIDHYEKALQYLEKTDNLIEIARAYHNLSTVYKYNDKFKDAIEFYKKQLDIVEKVGDIMLIGYGLANISICYAKLNQIKIAEKYLKRAEEIYERTNNENILFSIYNAKTIIFKYYKKWDKAISYLNKTLKWIDKLNVPFYIAETYYDYGLIYESKGEIASAKEYFQRAHSKYCEMGWEIPKKLETKLMDL